jgi:hypothetical protein
VKKHKSPLHKILHAFDLKPKHMEKIETIICGPKWTPTFHISIPENNVKNARTVSLRSPPVLWSGAGSRWKGLGFSLCAAPSQRAVLVFQSWVELSRDGVRAEVRTEIKDSRIRDGGELESELKSESEELQRCQNFAKSVESRIRLLI